MMNYVYTMYSNNVTSWCQYWHAGYKNQTIRNKALCTLEASLKKCSNTQLWYIVVPSKP